jgi:hypothetical protein
VTIVYYCIDSKRDDHPQADFNLFFFFRLVSMYVCIHSFRDSSLYGSVKHSVLFIKHVALRSGVNHVIEATVELHLN